MGRYINSDSHRGQAPIGRLELSNKLQTRLLDVSKHLPVDPNIRILGKGDQFEATLTHIAYTHKYTQAHTQKHDHKTHTQTNRHLRKHTHTDKYRPTVTQHAS